MAMIAVQLVLEKLAILVTEEARLLGGVGGGIEELRDDLESMKSFLQDAEARSESDQGAKAWVKQVRDVACDAEDAIDTFMIRLAPSNGHGFIRSLRNCYSSVRNLRAQHRLAVQIQSIKARVKAIAERRNAFSFNRFDMAANASTEKWHDPRIASLYIDEADVVGIENPRSTLVTWLVEGEEQLTSISVVGMGGLGKTTLVKKVFDSQPIKRCFDCHAWITVSKSFTPVELLRAALKSFMEATKEPVPNGLELMSDLQLVDALRKILQEKRYVVVFDDVWSVDAWETIKYAFPDCKCGSRIIFTTRLLDLGESIENTGHVYHLKPLPETEAWTLFCMKAFRGEYKGVCPLELEKMSRHILKKCEGLPLAIVAIGGLMSRKKKEALEWSKICNSLALELKSENDLGNLGRILLLSYNDLPYYLKQCYLYLSVFPEDYLIKRMKLIRLWVVERFVEEKPGLTMEQVAEGYLNELVSRSMIQVVDMNHSNRVNMCRVHDLMREIIQLKAKEESLVFIADQKNFSTSSKFRRLAIHDSCEDLPSDMRFPYLRSLLIFTLTDALRLSNCSFFRSFKLLRTLELERAPLYSFPPELVELIHLRYLSLRRTGVSELPQSIRKLKNLEILDLKGSLVSSLPTGILNLKSLSQLRGYSYQFGSSRFHADIVGMKIPSGIGRMTSLQKLGNIEIDDDPEVLRELGKLKQLTRLGILELSGEHGPNLCYTLDKMRQLTALYMNSMATVENGINMNSMTDHEVLNLDSLSSPPEYLQRLYIKCGLETLPRWLASLQYLCKLVLQYSHLKSDPLKALQDLSSLMVLELREAYDGEELCCDARGYPRLKKLSICGLERLKCIRLAEGALPGLRRLEIIACKELHRVPLGIEHLNTIGDLLLWDMPSEFFSTIRQSHGIDFWRVQHIQTITRIYEIQGRWAAETLH